MTVDYKTVRYATVRSLTVYYTTVHYTTVRNTTVHNKSVQHYKTVQLKKRYLLKKRYMFQNSTVTERYITKWFTDIHQPMDWLGILPSLPQPWIWSATYNRSPPTHGLIGLVEFCWLWLTISRVWLGKAKCPTKPWVGGGLLVITDYIQGQVRLGRMPNHSWVGVVLLVVTDDS